MHKFEDLVIKLHFIAFFLEVTHKLLKLRIEYLQIDLEN